MSKLEYILIRTRTLFVVLKNQFQCHINQSLIERQYNEMVSKARNVNGVPTSLLELGYASAGIDDCWQACSSGVGGNGFHDASGYPIVDKTLFPSMKSMTQKAKSLGILPGWYGNNCKCAEHRNACKPNASAPSICMKGDVRATLDFGFESIKLDGCGVEHGISQWAELFNATGKAVMIENCGNGPKPRMDSSGKLICPMNFFRVSDDIRPTFGSVLNNLQATRAYNEKNLTGPGCWGYPDMLEVVGYALQLISRHCDSSTTYWFANN